MFVRVSVLWRVCGGVPVRHKNDQGELRCVSRLGQYPGQKNLGQYRAERSHLFPYSSVLAARGSGTLWGWLLWLSVVTRPLQPPADCALKDSRVAVGPIDHMTHGESHFRHTHSQPGPVVAERSCKEECIVAG